MTDKLIFKKMTDVLRDFEAVGKDSKNTAQGYNFRSIDSMINTLHPILAKHEVFMAPRVVEFKSELREVQRANGKQAIDRYTTLLVEYTFYATDGSHVVIGPIASEGLDSGDKATNKALSAALKYALIQTFSVATEDLADADFDSPEISKPVVSKLQKVEAEAPKQEAKKEEVAKVVEAPKVEEKKPTSFRRKPVESKKVEVDDEL